MRRLRREKGFVLLLLAAIALTLIPMLGLAIDASVLYIVKARLSAACDAAALAAARNLNVGQTMAEQESSARNRATSFFNANFGDNYLGSQRLAPVVDIPVNTGGNTMTITTTGTANAQTYFLRALGVNTVTVSATGTASRRDVNLMLVLDRSDSMDITSSCEPMKDAAQAFVNRFVEGRDTVGLITFGTNTVLAFPPANNFKSAAMNIERRIEALTCGDSTSMTIAYWEAYKRLISLNSPGALNAIVLFTDGIPNGIYASFPIRRSTDTRFGYSGGTTGCTNTGATCTMPVSPCAAGVGSSVAGIIFKGYDSPWTGPTYGLTRPAGTTSNHNPALVTGSSCAWNTTNGGDDIRRDLDYIPDTDYYGNRTRGNTRQYLSYITTGTNRETTASNHVRLDRPMTISKASSNSMDHAAQRVRLREDQGGRNIGVVTFVIGLGNYSQPVDQRPDDTLMRRVANDPGDRPGSVASNIYVDDPELPDGMYIRAEDSGQMAEAFARIASEVLRISR